MYQDGVRLIKSKHKYKIACFKESAKLIGRVKILQLCDPVMHELSVIDKELFITGQIPLII